MSGFRPEAHVAQQSRRDKLRVQQTSTPSHHNLDTTFPNHLEQFTEVHSGLNNQDIVQVRNVRNANLLYDHHHHPTMFPSEMLDFSRNPNNALSSSAAQPHSFGFHNNSNNNNNDPQQNLDWVVNYGNESGQTNPMFYHNTLEDVITASSARNQAGIEISSLANELVLLPNLVNQSTGLRFDNAVVGSWMDRPVDHHQHNHHHHQWTDSNQPQGLSLSLSYNNNPPPKLPAIDGTNSTEDLNSTSAVKSGYLCSIPKPSIISKGCGGGKSLQDIVGVSGNNAFRNTGPLGPFTGYATILKSSKFLKPAQQLLDEFCRASGSKRFPNCGGDLSERMSGEVSVSVSADAMDAIETEIGGKGNNSCANSSSTFYGSNEISGSVSSESFRPEYQQKKAKLLYMQEEVGLYLVSFLVYYN